MKCDEIFALTILYCSIAVWIFENQGNYLFLHLIESGSMKRTSGSLPPKKTEIRLPSFNLCPQFNEKELSILITSQKGMKSSILVVSALPGYKVNVCIKTSKWWMIPSRSMMWRVFVRSNQGPVIFWIMPSEKWMWITSVLEALRIIGGWQADSIHSTHVQARRSQRQSLVVWIESAPALRAPVRSQAWHYPVSVTGLPALRANSHSTASAPLLLPAGADIKVRCFLARTPCKITYNN